MNKLCSLLTFNIKNVFFYEKNIDSEVNVEKFFKELLITTQKPENYNENYLLVIVEMDVIFPKSIKEKNQSIVSVFNRYMVAIRSVHNILVVGMANQFKDIDETIIETGHFDEYIGFVLPNLQVRKELVHTCTREILNKGLLDKEINFDFIAQELEGFTQNDICVFSKKAIARTFDRCVEAKGAINPMVTMDDFKYALNEMKIRRKENPVSPLP